MRNTSIFHCQHDILNPETQTPIMQSGQWYTWNEVFDLMVEFGFDYLIGYWTE